MQKTLEEWIEIFDKKTGEKFVRQKGFEIYYLPEKGFCEIGVEEKRFTVGAICGDGRFWRKFADEVARRCGFKFCATSWVRKSPLAYIRFFGYKVIKETENEIGKKNYLCVNDCDKKLTATYDHTSKNGHNFYRVLWEV